jgi:sialic acid synthase SpsE
VINTDKEVFVSSEKSPEFCKYYHNSNIKWMYCVPKYPCSLDEIDFKEISNFHGYSNHCTDVTAPVTAAILGAEIIEVHVTADKTKDYVDNNVSFDFSELKLLINEIEKLNKK